MRVLSVTIDGTEYIGIGISSIRRNATIKEDGNSGWTIDGTYRRSITGTYYDYSMDFYSVNADGETQDLYDQLHEVLSQPVNSHEIVVPYGSETLTFDAYIESVTDSILRIRGDYVEWGKMSVTFKSITPIRTL